ncbi:NAD(P)H-binding protein [Nocardia cyriacigeorgica]|uniref:NAD(P)H-binding protein n=1 Tax=Nocardia cyriacigeorgica TaxID=135487 RepID=A0A6P1D9E0_9NOCA|nr:NAD(P)H-binding protein [Nocardia cyriacigeorgica]NEW39805.1 NAD(P)H-binding protein [Nocardia cyriacigeorgica]NEW46269.1 NAD(P)H-binding protein [Nocardia cyriacigeorgica]NEW52439.1 NAD(P)H-binding protein [Nocardia cyriacigeorgica]NEW58432.1 NAD(P)H-binding protein [Nocardia cyriacigeorgica]
MSELIAVSGATGAIGGRVARRLASVGIEQRLLGRNAARAPQLPGAHFAVADYADPASVRTALAGVGTFLFVSATETRDRADRQRAVVAAAVAAGVRRIVYVSFVGAAPDCTFTFGRDHWWTEQEIRACGLEFTFLRDNFYQDMLPLLAGEDGVIRGPAGDGRIGAVARDDVADVAVAVLTGAEHDSHTYDVTGPRAFTLTEAAAMISDATGRSITYHPESLDEAYASRAEYGAEEWELTGWVSSYQAMATGELDVVTDTVSRLTGHPAKDFTELLAETT